jgi:chromosome segregation ATPase
MSGANNDKEPTMSSDRSEAMRQARRLDSQHRRTLVLAATDAAVQRGHHPSIAGLARQAGVGRKFIYDHPDLKAEIELKLAQATQRQASDMISAARVTGASLRAELENSRAQNQRLNKQLRALENRLSQAEGARLVADNLLPEGMLAELADQQLAQRNAELEQQLFDGKEQLRRTVEELEAARAINRELMQHANRPQPDRPQERPGGPTTPPPQRRRQP